MSAQSFAVIFAIFVCTLFHGVPAYAAKRDHTPSSTRCARNLVETLGHGLALQAARDYYLVHPARQPKSQIADYVSRQGVIVPRRFRSLNEAIGSGVPFIIRSEHPQEYFGASGLLDSFPVKATHLERAKKLRASNAKPINWDEPTLPQTKLPAILARHWIDPASSVNIHGVMKKNIPSFCQACVERDLTRLSRRSIDNFTRLLGIDVDEFRDEISYSYWELLPGFNRSIIADSSIAGRYHLFTARGESDGVSLFLNYSIIENGQVVSELGMKMPDDMKQILGSIRAFYEKIRRLDRFDPRHCPMVEFQTIESGQNYFLQYHRVRDFEPATFELTRPPEQGEIQADLVRGATPPEGVIVKTAGFYRNYELRDEDASFDFHYMGTFSSLMNRRRKVTFMGQKLFAIADPGHGSKSALFDAPVSIGIQLDSIVPEEVADLMYEVTKKTQIPATIRLRVISDGRRAYVRYLP